MILQKIIIPLYTITLKYLSVNRENVFFLKFYHKHLIRLMWTIIGTVMPEG